MEQVSEPFTIDLRRLTVLRELQRRGSLARTAEALHLTPSAVSQQIAALARETGVPLTEKDGRGVRLTGQARVLLAHADAIAAQLERARADLGAYGEGGRGSVTIGCLSSGILGLLPGVLRALADRLPQVRVDVVESEPPDLFTALDAGQVDVAVAVHFAAAPPHTDARYSRTELFTDVMDIAVPAGHRLAGRERVALRELAAEAWIVGDACSCVGAVARSVCAAAGFTPDIRHAVNDWGALAALVEAGQGVALVPRLVRPAYAHRDLALLTTEDGTPPSRHVFAAVRTGAEGDPVLATVLDQLRITGRELIGRDQRRAL
ncbi:LysR family transcriptional regulator [Streptomyces canus]|uniref:LysR family transcriptional regulator n=1 Tax=Streptomyces canus TaxID=58343 RepID=A0A101SG77_9ACTN|nr:MULTISPECIES: LysR family transcriptional regulator [Streptomyces]KUN73022.1 LysR family transcriptional regulator [Streptomyces canus]MDI5912994.1 LysR family transcriptional regulator [Streptomyces sp. 12257]